MTPPTKPKLSEIVANAVKPFYDDIAPRPEIVEGILAEGDLLALGGAYHRGKTPLLQDITICTIRGLPWCGLKTSRRPVILFDLESDPTTYKLNMKRLAERYGVDVADMEEEVDVYLLRGDARRDRNTAALLDALGDGGLKLIRRALARKPNALVVIDPPEMLLTWDTTKKRDVLKFYKALREIVSDYPRAGFWLTFNLRKKNFRLARPNLLKDPHAWLEEICGSLDLMNRCDTRLGIDFVDKSDEELRVLNGIRRAAKIWPRCW